MIPILSIVLAAFVVLSTGSSVGAVSAGAKVVIAYPTMSSRTVPLWVAEEEGYFKKYGIRLELVYVRSDSLLMSALASDDIQLVVTGGSAVLNAAAGGLDVKIMANFFSRALVDLVARPGIKGVKDLRGKRIGVQSIGGTNWMYVMQALEQLGLDPGKDRIQILVVGDVKVLIQSLETGTIDAMAASDRAYSLRLKQQGYPTLAELRLAVGGSGLIVKRTYLQQHPDLVESILKAILEGLAFALAPTNKALILDTLTKRLRISDPGIAELAYQDLLKGLDRKPYPSIEGLQNLQRLIKLLNPRVGGLNLNDLVDSSFIRKLDESGFIDRLHKSYGDK